MGTITHLADRYVERKKRETTEALVIELGKPVHEILCAELQRAFEADPAFAQRVSGGGDGHH